MERGKLHEMSFKRTFIQMCLVKSESEKFCKIDGKTSAMKPKFSVEKIYVVKHKRLVLVKVE